jgi:hypothetical protein
LLVEYQLDVIEENPLEAHRLEDGNVQFRNTGDPMIDLWEQQIADGFSPDLGAAFSTEELSRIQKKIAKVSRSSGRGPTTFGDVVRTTDQQLVSMQESDSVDNPFSVFGKLKK